MLSFLGVLVSFAAGAYVGKNHYESLKEVLDKIKNLFKKK